jgi:hypothetical protein
MPGAATAVALVATTTIATSVEILPDRVDPGLILMFAGLGSLVCLATASLIGADDALWMKRGTLGGGAIGLVLYLTLAAIQLLS